MGEQIALPRFICIGEQNALPGVHMASVMPCPENHALPWSVYGRAYVYRPATACVVPQRRTMCHARALQPGAYRDCVTTQWTRAHTRMRILSLGPSSNMCSSSPLKLLYIYRSRTCRHTQTYVLCFVAYKRREPLQTLFHCHAQHILYVVENHSCHILERNYAQLSYTNQRYVSAHAQLQFETISTGVSFPHYCDDMVKKRERFIHN